MRKFKSSQKEESRVLPGDSSKACSKHLFGDRKQLTRPAKMSYPIRIGKRCWHPIY